MTKLIQAKATHADLDHAWQPISITHSIDPLVVGTSMI
jgi:hypothetical protein